MNENEIGGIVVRPVRLLTYDFGEAVMRVGISRIVNGKLERPFYSYPCLRVSQFFRAELWVAAWPESQS